MGPIVIEVERWHSHAAIEWANQILMADRMEARRG